MKSTIIIITAAAAGLLCSCQPGTVATPLQPRANVETVERSGRDVPANNNHGQHAAGANAVDYSNPGHRSAFYGLRRGF